LEIGLKTQIKDFLNKVFEMQRKVKIFLDDFERIKILLLEIFHKSKEQIISNKI
jgi:hypothetical protein